jgi:hypothetical protein
MSRDDGQQIVETRRTAELGPHRAWYYRDETGTAIKIRPNVVPEASWRAATNASLQRRGS